MYHPFIYDKYENTHCFIYYVILIQTVGYDKWSKQATQMMECTSYLKKQLDKMKYPCWVNEYSNTVFFKRPSPDLVQKYNLAQGYDERFGGDLAHIVVMHAVCDKRENRRVHFGFEEKSKMTGV